MRTLHLALAIGFSLLTFISNSQTPGYLGKKVILSGQVSGMPLVGYLAGNDSPIDLNLRYAVKTEFVLLKNLSLGLRLEKMEDIIYIRNWSTAAQLPIEMLIDPPMYYGGWSEEYEFPANYSVLSYGTFLRLYNHINFGSIAPLGRYYNLEFQVNRVNVYDDGRYHNNGQRYIHNLTTQTLIVGTGIQNIFFNHLTTDLSVNVGLNIAGLNAFKEDYYTSIASQNVFGRIDTKLFSDNIFSARLSIGWLLF